MERKLESNLFGAISDESEPWIQVLEANGVATLLGGVDDQCKVIAVADHIWRRGGPEGRSSLHSPPAAPAAPWKSGVSGLIGTQPQNPKAFVAELKRHFRERGAFIWLGSTALPIEMKPIVDRLRQSQGILDDEADAEKDDNRHLLATWQRAARFVLKASLGYWGSRQAVPPTPAINAGPDGSIDIAWRQGASFVAANVPEVPVDVVTIYGRDPSRPNRRLRVEEDPEVDGSWVLEWLMR